MTSRERVLRTLARGEADRVPVNYDANAGIDGRLKAHFGLGPKDGEGLLRALGVDFRRVGAPYAGPRLHADIPERGVRVSDWGIHTRWIEHGSGGYWDFCDFPLREATVDQVASWPMPDPDRYDYSTVALQCRRHQGYALCLQCYGDLINGNGMLRSMEQTLVDLITDDPAGLLLADRRFAIQEEVARRTLEAADGRLDVLWLGEDLGTQDRPMISMDIFRRHFRPRYQRLVDLGRAHGARVMIHTCGASSWAYEEFVEMGIDAVDTLQPEARNMSPAYLKRTFGGRLAFHGCISTAGPVAYGSPGEVTQYCRDTLAVMMPGGGYCFAPTHQLQDNSPTGNVVAMYEAARRYGVY
ncbi:MAG: uroporphyrinogen decarboxylase family protein [Candidatus Latescibacterota bacterium]